MSSTVPLPKQSACKHCDGEGVHVNKPADATTGAGTTQEQQQQQQTAGGGNQIAAVAARGRPRPHGDSSSSRGRKDSAKLRGIQQRIKQYEEV